MVRVLVTGAGGFAGGHLVRLLLSDPRYRVIAVHGRRLLPDVGDHRLERVAINLTDQGLTKSLIKEYRPDLLIHLAGMAVTHGKSLDEYQEANVRMTQIIGESVLEFCGSACRMLHVSSASVYGERSGVTSITESCSLRPTNFYGYSKAASELILWPLIHRGLDVRIARAFNHTGPGQARGFVCVDLLDRLLEEVSTNSGDFHLSNGGAVRDFTDVRDVVRAYVQIVNEFSAGSVVNVCSGQAISIRKISEELLSILQLDQVRIVDGHGEGKVESSVVGDPGLLKTKTGWNPSYSLKTTLHDLWRHRYPPAGF